MGTCGHGGEIIENRHQGVDLAALARQPGDGHLYVFALDTDDENEKSTHMTATLVSERDDALNLEVAASTGGKLELSQAAIEVMASKVAEEVVKRLKGS